MYAELPRVDPSQIDITFERSIRLPEFADGDRIAAEFNNGLLKVQVPKAPAAQPRRIEVKPSSPGGLSSGSPAEISNN